MSRAAPTLLALATALAVAAPAEAIEDVERTTISAIERGEAPAVVYLEGAALDQLEEAGMLFSDGTGVMRIVVDQDARVVDQDAGEEELPLFELVSIEGTVTGDVIDVHQWALLPIFKPAVIVEEPQVIEAFWGWIIAFGSQAPGPAE